MALWKARSLSPEQKVQIIEEESEVKSLQTDESGSFLGLDDVSMSEVHSSSHAVPVSSFALYHTYHLLLLFFPSYFSTNNHVCCFRSCSKSASPLEL